MTSKGVPSALLERYTTNAPRYTSYPTAPQLRAVFDRGEIMSRWRHGGAGPLSLYVHLPFCESRCLYCACTTEIGHDGPAMDRYLDGVERELGRHVETLGRSTVSQLALGGGTPMRLGPDRMRRLVEDIGARFNYTVDAERSIEIDPRGVEAEDLDVLVELGFNRFSFGVQDLDAEVQARIRRVLKADRLAVLVGRLRDLGRPGINLDLMYGLPGQSPRTFAATLEKVREIRPSRVAVFGYAHVPWMSPHQEALASGGLPSSAERLELQTLAYETLRHAGYEAVGMDHFALPGDELLAALESRTLTRGFMGYTTRRGLDLVGVGASAISSVGGTYTQNVRTVAEYMTSQPPPWFRALALTDEDRLRRDVILDLFCNFYVDLAAVASGHFASELAALRPLAEDGLLILLGEEIEVTELGRFFIRRICMTFDQYLAAGDGRPRYSRT